MIRPASMLLADAVVQGSADVAIGSRFRGQLQYRVPWVKRAGMAVFAWTVSQITGRQVTDPDVRVSGAERGSHAFLRRGQLPGGLP